MKLLYPVAAAGMILLASSSTPAQSSTDLLRRELAIKSQTAPALPQGTSTSWYEAATRQIAQREYQFKTLEDKNFGAFNRRNQMGFYVSDKGYAIKSVDPENEMAVRWEATFKINGISRQSNTLSLKSRRSVEMNEDVLRLRYKDLTVEYINKTNGLRQNFIIHKRLPGKAPLKVLIDINSDLQPRLNEGQSLQLHMPGSPNDVRLVYDGLKAWDASHRPLKAHMEFNGTQLSLVVDDRNAAYPITIDPLNHTPDWTDSGQGLLFPLLDDLSLHLLYGFTVSSAGNVNNDAFDDIIIGAPAYVDIISVSGGTFNAVSVGAAFIYYGSGSGPSANPTEVLQPTTTAGALFGFSVSKAGDVNGDGFDDIVVGAPGDRITLLVGLGNVSVAVGRVYVYYGSTFNGDVNSEPTVSVTLNLTQADFGVLAVVPANPLYGFSVSHAGDINNDTYGDIVVGSPAFAGLIPVTLGGRVDVYRGSNTGLNTTPQTIVGPILPALFGYSVSTAGRVNNDAFDDIIVGAPASLGLVSVGSAYIFHGSAGGVTATTAGGANTTLQEPGLLNQTFFGYSVSDAGDVNGDGLGDVIVGEPLSLEQTLSLELVAVGKAHIYYGTATGITATGSTQLTSPRSPNLLGLVQGNLLFGFSVSGAGDMNCDGLSDVIVGEPGGTGISLGTGVLGLVSASALSGKAYVFYGRSNKPVNSPSFLVQETSALSVANLLGATVSDAGDVNGDGNADLLIGAPNGTMNFASSLTGIIGNAVGIITQNSIGSAYSYFGCLTDIDLDFDNDGIPDAIDLDDDNDGTPDLSEYPGLTITGDPAGDADGDGIPNYQDPDFTGCGGLNAQGTCTNFDKDGDGVPNSFDLDSDNDGIPDVIESGGVDTDGDGVLDNFTDTDDDGLSQSIDANNTGAAGSGTGLGSPDFDDDGLGNSYDLDSDGDGISDIREAGLPDADNNALIDGFTDTDGDGFANAVDPRIGHSGSSDPASGGTPALTTPTDTNNNGTYDGNPTTGNPDGDARFNFLDLDSDNDGITDNVEGQSTTGYVLPASGDADNDGLTDTYDSQGGIYTAGGIIPNNQDAADEPDYLDTDTDNDGKLDIVEGHDINGNGLPDDNTTLTGTDADGDGIDDRFDLEVGPNATTEGMGNPPIPGSVGPLQTTSGVGERDWRNALFALPLRLVTFTGSQVGDNNQLDWVSANEENFSHFEIERSADGSNFTSIGRQAGMGSPSRSVDYRYIDRQPLPGKNFYRLRMVDIDNKYGFSNVLMLSSGGQPGITIYPNPVKNYIQVQWKDATRGDYKIDVMNSSGQVITTLKTTVNSGTQVMMIHRGQHWKPGIYMLRVTSGSDHSIAIRKIIVE